VDELLRELSVTRKEIESGHSFSAVKYGQLYQRVMWLVQDECFGMMSGGKVRIGSFRLMCLTVIHAETLRQAIFRAAEFSEICRGFTISSQLEQVDSRTVRLRMAGIESLSDEDFQSLMSQKNADRIRTSLAVWHRFNCWLIGKEIPLLSISYSFECPDSFTELAESAQAEIKFGQEYNGFEFDAKYLESRVIQNAKSLDDFIRSAPYHLVIRDSATASVKAKVRSILSRDVSGAMPGAEAVASKLHLSVTTLRRHLQKEETSFQKLKDECRLEAAIHYLACPDITNNSIAERLGFDEASAFFRAFKKWTGITPGEYRKQLLLQQA
jgi:AraC-like DNA-binding protein